MITKANNLHEKVAERFKEVFDGRKDWTLLVDKACGGHQRIPLFMSDKKSRESEYCNVDLALLNKDVVRTIVEIEESNVKPTQVCGKFLTSALCRYYIHETDNGLQKNEMAHSVTFIQIVQAGNIVKGRSRKPEQWEKLETSIQNILPLKGSNIREYKLFTTNELDRLTTYLKNS